MSLKNIAVSTKEITTSYPGKPHFKVKVAYLSREVSSKITKDCTYTTFNSKSRIMEETLDENKFIQMFASKVILGWSGLLYKDMPDLMVCDLSEVDPEEEVAFDLDNAIELLKKSTAFDNWINEVIFDIQRFRD